MAQDAIRQAEQNRLREEEAQALQDEMNAQAAFAQRQQELAIRRGLAAAAAALGAGEQQLPQAELPLDAQAALAERAGFDPDALAGVPADLALQAARTLTPAGTGLTFEERMALLERRESGLERRDIRGTRQRERERMTRQIIATTRIQNERDLRRMMGRIRVMGLSRDDIRLQRNFVEDQIIGLENQLDQIPLDDKEQRSEIEQAIREEELKLQGLSEELRNLPAFEALQEARMQVGGPIEVAPEVDERIRQLEEQVRQLQGGATTPAPTPRRRTQRPAPTRTAPPPARTPRPGATPAGGVTPEQEAKMRTLGFTDEEIEQVKARGQ